MEVEQVVVRLVADTTQYFASLKYAGARLLGYSAGLVTGIAKHGIQMAATFEKNSVAVRTMVGDFEEGNKLLQDITNLAIETPFSSDELVAVTKQLKAFGFETQDIIPTLTALGNVSSGTGTDIHRITLAFGQVKVAGKLMGTELRQFVDAGVPLIETLGKVMNKPAESIRSLVEQGHVGFQQVAEAFNMMNAEGGKFAGLMDTISKTTIGGRWQAFRETLDVASRNFSLAAIEGLRLKNALDGAVKSLKDLNQAGGASTVALFRDVRTVISDVWMILSKIVDAIGHVIGAVSKWAMANEFLLKYVLLVVGVFWSLYAVTKAVTVSLLAVRMALAAVYTLSGLASVVSSFLALKALIISIVATVGPFLTAFIPIVGIINVIGVALYKIGAFKFSGTAFSEGISALKELKRAFGGIVDALQSGDIETAWELITTSFLYAWRVMTLTIKGEWGAFLRGLSEGLNIHIKAALSGFNYAALRKGDEAKAALLQNELEVAVAKSQFGLSDKSAIDLIDYQRQSQDALARQQRLEEAMAKAVALNTPRFPGDVVGDTSKQIKEYKAAILELVDLRTKIDKMVQGIIGRAGTEKEAKLVQGMASDPHLVRLKGELDRLLQKVEDNKKLAAAQQATEAGVLSQMAVTYSISGQARDVMNKLEKELSRGVGAWDKFSRDIALINEARWGSAKGQQIAGAVGGFALTGKMAGQMEDGAYLYGLYKAQEELAKGLSANKRTSPALMFGSTAAQDVINANLDRKASVEEQVLDTLIQSKIVAEQQREYQKEVAEVMKKFIANGTMKKLGINDQ